MKASRTRWAGLAALALVGGLLTPVIVAPGAQAATITRADADCTTGSVNTGAAIAGNPGDVIDITGVLTDCDLLFIPKDLVDDTTAITVSNVTATTIPITDDITAWKVASSSDFSQIEVTLGSTAVTTAKTIELSGFASGTGVITEWDVTISGSPPVPPTPIPATPPSAPASAVASAGNGEATVLWTAPASQGSFPVTNYQVQSTPSSQGCLVPATATTCRIAGLRNGTAYTFQVRALNGGGWGSWATTESVVPRPEPDPEASIMITGSRSANERVARVSGETTGLTGATLQAMVRLSSQTQFAAGSTRQVSAQGGFTWQRRTPATVSVEVYFTAGDIASNTVTIAGS